MTKAIDRLVKMKYGEWRTAHPYSDKTATGLLRCIKEYISLSYGYFEETTSLSELYAIKNGRFVLIEIRKDIEGIPAKAMEALRDRSYLIEAHGGVYIIARSFSGFLRQWNAIRKHS